MKKKFWLVGVLFVMVLALVACNTSTEDTAENGDKEGTDTNDATVETSSEKPYVAIVSKGFQHQFWQAVKQGAEKAADEFDVTITFEGPETESQVDKQIEMLQAVLDKKPAALGFAALDSKAAIPLLTDADAKNIPIIAFDSGVDSDLPLATASTDNTAAAALAADKMAEAIGNKGKIALIVHDQVSVTGAGRRDGFKNQIESKYPDIEIVDIQYGGGDHLKSTDLAKAIMQAHPDLKGIFGSNEGSAIGVVNAVQELNKTGEIVVVGFDSGKQQIDAIKSGLMVGAVTQNPVGIGYETVKAAVAAIKGESVEKVIDTGFYWYDKDNIDSAEIKAAIYE
ncbi:ABC transporter substrate-binding protein [Lysinibacillus sp. NPDC096418]|uniref:ABC transporter substrate-binding protein n=1 Tax=Lysinibacillus sp. NPDC096418 TaxID=3364138 RepID=UPI00382AA772